MTDIPDHIVENAREMFRAANEGNCGVVQCTDKADGRVRYFLTVRSTCPDEPDKWDLFPIAEMFMEDPRTFIDPPRPMDKELN